MREAILDAAILRALACRFLDAELLTAAGIDPTATGRLPAAMRAACAGPVGTKLSHFFDPGHYAAHHSALGDANPLLHYLEIGAPAGLSPHPFIDLDFMRTRLPEVSTGALGIADIMGAIDGNLCPPSPYFDPAFYASRHMEEADGSSSPFRHYCERGYLEWAAPNPYLNPLWYAVKYGDVADVGRPEEAADLDLAAHFIRFGDLARRRPSLVFDPEWYCRSHADLSNLEIGPLYHFLKHGLAEGRRPNPASEMLNGAVVGPNAVGDPGRVEDWSLPIENASTVSATYARLKAEMVRREKREIDAFKEVDILPVRGSEVGFDVRRLAFPHHETPAVSILVPCYNEFEVTYECLLSILRSAPAVPYEVVLADDASTDPATGAFEAVENLRYLRQSENVGFLRNCNSAYAQTRGAYVLLFNNDAQLMPGTLDALYEAIRADPEIGAVGPKILYPNGRLQEAGCTISATGTTQMIGLFRDPNLPEFNRARAVDYCSGAALLLRKSGLEGPLFDERFAPAYCEDVDLCLRVAEAGLAVHYEPKAVVVHHLSVSTRRQSEVRRVRTSLRNQQTLFEKWAPRLEAMNRVRLMAFYLPQFHPVVENDFWWGKGFTEWTNVTAARPSYVGHYQPHLPSDLGFYDLRLPEVMGQQYALARRYGIEGFCVYYYNFGGRRILEQPMEQLLLRPDILFRYCLCWANENWTKHWDGGSREVLLAQTYDEATIRSMARDAARFARDERSITVNGKPMFVIYRPLLIPRVQEAARVIRDEFDKLGLPGVHLAYVESMETIDKGVRPEAIGFDAAIEFPPQGVAERNEHPTRTIREGWDGHRYAYSGTVLNAVSRYRPNYARYPAAFPSWDNTPRQPLKGTSFDGTGPELFQAYMEAKIREARIAFAPEEQFVFVNAWNEWAEGAHLEPDRALGHRWLQAVRDAARTEGVFPT